MLKNLKWIISIVAAAILGLILFQAYWISHAFLLKKKDLENTMQSALIQTCKAAEENTYCFRMYSKSYIKPGEGIYMLKHKWENTSYLAPSASTVDSLHMFNLFPFSKQKGDTFVGMNDMMFSYPATVDIALTFEYKLEDSALFKQGSNYEPDQQFKNITYKNYQEKLSEHIPVKDRMEKIAFHKMLHAELRKAGIDDSVCYAVRKKDSAGFEYVSCPALEQEISRSPVRAELFNTGRFSQAYEILVYSSQQSGHVLQSIMGMMLTSLVIIVILILAFVYFIRTIMRQKKLSEMKTDFINNMTHEFKTPITNIALALETLDEVGNKDGQLGEKILHIIGEENAHMRDNVERILQIAMTDRGQLQMHPESINLHLLISKVVKNFEIPLAAAQGQVEFNMKAEKSRIMGDETHLVNVFYNLVDNAIKYSQANPRILISTYNRKDELIIEVSDKGIGMSREVQKNVFSKFYRAYTGNVHNVKGFGLGLSYVKDIIELHHGSIELESEPGIGTTFTLSFKTTA